MAWSFGDSFDLYAATADMATGYWDSMSGTFAISSTSRFSGSRALAYNAVNSTLVKASSVNDAVHHIACAFYQNAAITGSSPGAYFTLFDGATAQCSVVFRSDGAILLQSGAVGGTTLATYTSAFTVTTTWYAFEIEVVINNTTGSFKVRKNGNPADDFSATSLNTRASANNYANKLQTGAAGGGTTAHIIDDLFWRSDAVSVAWMGDIRCYTRMPASDSAVQFSRTPTGVLTQTVALSIATSTNTSGAAFYTAFTAGWSGTVTSATILWSAMGTTTSMKCAIFADNGAGGNGGPGAVLAASSSGTITPVVGNNVFAFSPGVSVVKGTRYWVGACPNGAGFITCSNNNQAAGATGAMSLAAFPQANPVVTNPTISVHSLWTYDLTPANWQAVSEAQADTTTYVYSSTVNNADLYGISSIPATPASVIATTTRIYGQKSDAGSRTVAAQIKSGTTTVASPTLALTTSGFQWAYRTDTTDPNTGSAWTPGAVNGVQIGPKVIF